MKKLYVCLLLYSLLFSACTRALILNPKDAGSDSIVIPDFIAVDASCSNPPCECDPGDTKICEDVGECKNGTASCVDGQWDTCQWEQGPSVELCDGLDNDCNNAIDDNLSAPLCTKTQGVCTGHTLEQNCGGSAGWIDCEDSQYQAYASTNGKAYEAVESSCDGDDNDCDGTVDENYGPIVIDNTSLNTRSGIYTKFDSQGFLHISYRDENLNRVIYATNKTGVMQTEVAYETEAVDEWNPLAIDSNDVVHIAMSTTSGMKILTNQSGSWATQDVQTQNGGGGTMDMVLDSNNAHHLAYYSLDSLDYVTDKSGSWVTERINQGGVCLYPSMKVDQNNHIHVAYYVKAGGNLKYATNTSGSWVSEILSFANDVGRYPYLLIDRNNFLHISCVDNTAGTTPYLTNISGTWIESVLNTGFRVHTMDTDSSNHLYLARGDTANDYLVLTTNESGSWQNTTLDTSGTLGLRSSTIVDKDDNIHIVYTDTTVGSESVKYMKLCQ